MQSSCSVRWDLAPRGSNPPVQLLNCFEFSGSSLREQQFICTLWTEKRKHNFAVGFLVFFFFLGQPTCCINVFKAFENKPVWSKNTVWKCSSEFHMCWMLLSSPMYTCFLVHVVWVTLPKEAHACYSIQNEDLCINKSILNFLDGLNIKLIKTWSRQTSKCGIIYFAVLTFQIY